VLDTVHDFRSDIDRARRHLAWRLGEDEGWRADVRSLLLEMMEGWITRPEWLVDDLRQRLARPVFDAEFQAVTLRRALRAVEIAPYNDAICHCLKLARARLMFGPAAPSLPFAAPGGEE
jgi:hypothetical protein